MNDNLDINTPRGAESLAWEADAIGLLAYRYPDTRYIATNKSSRAYCDGLLIKDRKLFGIAETKCRNMSLETLSGQFKFEWLLTYDKMLKCRDIAEGLQTDFWAMLYLMDDPCLLLKKLWSPVGGWTVPFRREITKTQATINGGEAIRENAYIDMSKATIICPPNRPAPIALSMAA